MVRDARRSFVASVGEEHASLAPDEVGPSPWLRALLGLLLGIAAGALAAVSLPRPTPSEPSAPSPRMAAP